jgi:hypothetical protein
MVVGFAEEMGIQQRVVEFSSSQEARELSPSAYGTMGIVYDGRLLSYHYLNKERLQQALVRVGAWPPLS